jgi:hypothetical protein
LKAKEDSYFPDYALVVVVAVVELVPSAWPGIAGLVRTPSLLPVPSVVAAVAASWTVHVGVAAVVEVAVVVFGMETGLGQLGRRDILRTEKKNS